MAKRDYPNNSFAWYNDDDKLGILCLDTSSTSGEKTKEKYDSYSDSTVPDGIRIHYHAKYGKVENVEDDLKKDIGVDSGMHSAVVCYVKSRLYEDLGQFEQAQYFRQMYEMKIKKYPSRKSGVRTLSVPRL
jgi:hypothetical protein